MKTMYKLSAVITLVLSLSGCANVTNLYNSYFMAKYDPMEHSLVNKIKVDSELSKPYCTNHELAKIVSVNLFSLSSELKNFSNHLPNNDATVKMTDSLFVLVDEFNKRYQTTKEVNKTYCELKLQSISDNADTIQKVIAKRPRS